MRIKKWDHAWEPFAQEPTFNDAVIDRVLKSVGRSSQGKKLIRNVNRGELAKRLEVAEVYWKAYSAAHGASPKRVRQTRAKPFRSLVKAAMHFKRELCAAVIAEVDADSVRTEVIALRWRSVFTTTSLEAFLVNLDRVIHVADAAAQAYEYKPSDGLRSPKEWFVGTILAQIFKECFGKKAGQSGGKESTSKELIEYGPFTRFVKTIMKEMQEEITTDIIKRALRPSRRKHRQTKRPRGR
jgi:hypothetical protein